MNFRSIGKLAIQLFLAATFSNLVGQLAAQSDDFDARVSDYLGMEQSEREKHFESDNTAAILAEAVVTYTKDKEKGLAELVLALERVKKSDDASAACRYCYKLILESGDKDDLWAITQRQRPDSLGVLKNRLIKNALSAGNEPNYAKAHIWQARTILRKTSNTRTGNARIEKNTPLSLAQRQLEFALKLEPDNLDAKLLLVDQILIPLKKYEQAFTVYVGLFQEDVAYFVKIAEVAVRMKEIDRATPYIRAATERYDQLLSDEPKNATYLQRQAKAFALLGEHKKGIDRLKTAIKTTTDEDDLATLNSTVCKIHLAYAKLFEPKAKTDDEARKNFLAQVILAHNANPSSDVTRIALTRYGYSKFPDAKEALDAYSVIDDIDNAPSEALQIVGTVEVIRGQKRLGTKLLQLAVDKGPRNHVAANNLAFILHISEPERALALANQAVKLNPNSYQYFDTRSKVFEQLGRFDEAKADLERALSLATDFSSFAEIEKSRLEQLEKLKSSKSDKDQR